MINIGVVADTHVPDRVLNLHPGIIPAFQSANVGAILHAGDICVPAVVHELESVAPVIAARGNRDWLFRRSLKWTEKLEYAGMPLVLAHGHGSWESYFWDKLAYFSTGYRSERYTRRMVNAYPEAKVIVFGHTHRPLCCRVDGRLLFNPGTASELSKGFVPTIGLLHFQLDSSVDGEIIYLKGATIRRRKWVEAIESQVS